MQIGCRNRGHETSVESKHIGDQPGELIARKVVWTGNMPNAAELSDFDRCGCELVRPCRRRYLICRNGRNLARLETCDKAHHEVLAGRKLLAKHRGRSYYGLSRIEHPLLDLTLVSGVNRQWIDRIGLAIRTSFSVKDVVGREEHKPRAVALCGGEGAHRRVDIQGVSLGRMQLTPVDVWFCCRKEHNLGLDLPKHSSQLLRVGRLQGQEPLDRTTAVRADGARTKDAQQRPADKP
jgi:hypothetical protein